jgi:hypothetical protein
LPVVSWQLPVASCQLPVASSQLPVAGCRLPVACLLDFRFWSSALGCYQSIQHLANLLGTIREPPMLLVAKHLRSVSNFELH